MYPYSTDYGSAAGAVPLGKPRPVHQQPSFGDVQLFGDDEPPLFTTPLASSSTTSPNFGAPNDLPLPDLIPDSPTDFSPPNTYSLPFQHSSAYQQQQQQRNERSSSVPVPSFPKPIRRRTQEFKDQQSFVPTLYGHPLTAGGGLQNPFAPAPPPPAFAAGNGFNAGARSPSTDHPLSLPEQQDLLDRVRRDLHGVDLDNIKGPLRALALSSNPPRQPSSFGPPNIDLPPSPQHFPLGALHQLSQQQQREKDEMMRKTVSPQEAFLDYEDVDHRLHPSGMAGSPFGVGVGASLFAPIPRAASQPTATRTPPPLSTSHSASPSRASSPGGVGLSTSPHGASLFGSARKPHPFAVPQNAVSWKDRRQASGDDANGEDDEGSDDDEDSPVVKQEEEGVGAGGKGGVRNQPQESSSDDDEVDDGGVIGEFDEDTKPSLPPLGSTTTRPTHLPPPATATSTSLFIPPAPAPTRTSPAPAATAHEHMRPSARRALDLLQHFNDPVPGLNGDDGDASSKEEEEDPDADAEGEVDDEITSLPSRSSARATSSRAQTAEQELDDEDYVPTTSTTASGRPARSTAGQRKRTRSPFAEEAPSDSEASDPGDGESFHASGGSDSDAPPRASSSSTSHRRTAPAPNKRRRRVPPSSSLHSTSSTAIRCPHVNSDGTTCGVVFRRPYDLARHRETIHGETAEGKATKKVEWTCKGCGGTFSRKDALIRHARIRGHKSGI
ncbi:hypothetical protein BCR35DRAFT_306258 [Leucosporidium creatinivorum]|uniref:C2H2-type domain-containing protein n=1 Tax=Leucosporidium creatinivorum TaxID=106004 RepID=A0A1Y2EUM8_9BASI|nr:hypothetical protein BCR35DRAFT_306258 [Leucosporidium creatinivorum]